MALPDLHFLLKSTRESGVKAGSILPLDFRAEDIKVSEEIETSESAPAERPEELQEEN